MDKEKSTFYWDINIDAKPNLGCSLIMFNLKIYLKTLRIFVWKCNFQTKFCLNVESLKFNLKFTAKSLPRFGKGVSLKIKQNYEGIAFCNCPVDEEVCG